MKKIGTFLLFGIALLFALTLLVKSFEEEKKEPPIETNKVISENQDHKPADKIQIFVFHGTQRCPSCIKIGEYAKATLEKNFSDVFASGKIEFREINIDLPENKELAKKFKATGSSLFINAINDGKDQMKENVQVWRLVTDKDKFIDYLSGEINKLI